ncbi:fibronectin type III domain-containing protein [Arcticibacter eurypsychrophilus]|uniref:fibronectin type III domain-containing protein n=1 Tax=Arcticibacter eurypsychrophilus TaxID=1434752 RepID=UPI001FDF3387|nr:fibronectin type III domain-containing protein [Arcticibacter eurypsychrophilus]
MSDLVYLSHRSYFLFFLLLLGTEQVFSQTASKIVYMESGRLTYVGDRDGNRVPDFSYAGYKGGGVPIPTVKIMETVSAIEGDNTVHIQSALDKVAALHLGSDGFRGAVFLKAGKYDIQGTLYINASGVVLRGAGDNGDSSTNTILIGKGDVPHQRNILVIGGKKEREWADSVTGTRTDIVTEFLPVGSRSFTVSDARLFKVADNIIIKHPSTQAWVDAVQGGGTDADKVWISGKLDILYNRHITEINGNMITIDAPVYNHLNRSLSQSFIYKYDRTGLVTNVGVENLRIDIESSDSKSEKHANNAVAFNVVENAWAKSVTALHFRQSGFITQNATFITVQNCKALYPNSAVTGGRRYNFNADEASNNILFENCEATNARHDFVANGASTASGVVFVNCLSQFTKNTSEGHRRWSQGLLYDNITFAKGTAPEPVLALYNRGSFGTGHGWAAVHAVIWNVKAPGKKIIVQKPPTGQNYCFMSEGIISGDGPFKQPAGYIEGTGELPLIPSLYAAQLKERLKYGMPPDAPALVKAINSAGNITISWDDLSPSETGYEVERSTDSLSNFTLIARLPANKTMFLDRKTSEETCFYRVRAVGENGKSAYGNLAEEKK